MTGKVEEMDDGNRARAEDAAYAAKRSRDHRRRQKRVAALGYADAALYHEGCADMAAEIADDLRARLPASDKQE